MVDADNYRLQNELGWHDDRGNLLRFLDDPSIEPTNNRAERALRPAVIARKVSHCSKTVEGADAFSAFTSLIRTLERSGDDQPVVDSALRCFQWHPRPFPFTLNACPNLIPLINYAYLTTAITSGHSLTEDEVTSQVEEKRKHYDSDEDKEVFESFSPSYMIGEVAVFTDITTHKDGITRWGSDRYWDKILPNALWREGTMIQWREATYNGVMNYATRLGIDIRVNHETEQNAHVVLTDKFNQPVTMEQAMAYLHDSRDLDRQLLNRVTSP